MICLIKFSNDTESFNFAKSIGMNVIELHENENVDSAIKNLVQSNCTNIVLSSEVAGFSEDIIKKYNKNSKVNIYIAPSKRNK